MSQKTPKIKLNLGSGHRKKDDYVNIDIDSSCNPDIVMDIENGLPFEKDNVSEIFAHDFLEHIRPEKVLFVLEEIYRVLEPNGVLDFSIPSTDGRGAFEHPDHKSFWNINSWKYFLPEDQHRIVNGYKPQFEGRILDHWTDSINNIIHTKGRVHAIKN